MTNISLGDLASSFQLRNFSVQRKTDLTRLAQELTTGLKADLGAAVAGDFGPFAGIERSLRANAAYSTANTEAQTLFGSAQVALESIQTITEDLSPALLTASSARDRTLIDATAEDARQKFASITSRLNTQVADRSLFAGAATDGPAISDAQDMLGELVLAVAGLTTAADVDAAVEAWFDDAGGGFETTGYLGSDNDMGSMLIADDESIQMTVRADDQVVRDTLKGYAMAALVAEGVLSSSIDEQAEMIELASTRMLAANGDITSLRATVGSIEARIEDAAARNAAAGSAYELARGEMVNADPYETATMLETVYAQIETLYTVTSRLSALKFSDYM